MSHKKPTLPVVDTDQAFPLLTTAGSTPGPSTAGGDQAPSVAAAIKDVLGWRPRPQDPRAFSAALAASFELRTVEGHVEARHVARGFAVQADLGAITGGQASLYTRARTAHTEITRLLDGLTPLRPDADPEDCEAYRTLVRDSVRRIVDELGTPGGPRVPLVNSAFRTLTGTAPAGPLPTPLAAQQQRGLRSVGAPAWPAPSGPPTLTADGIPGTLGALRDRFGLTDDNVNTVDEEKVRTSFLTLVDLVVDLQRSWQQQVSAFGGGSGSGYLGTDLILINRLLAAAAEQTDEIEMVLDSALVSAAERQTLVLDRGNGLTLAGLLDWLRTFLTEDGPRLAQDTGRDGITTSITPTVIDLLETVRTSLISRIIPCGSATCVNGCGCSGHPVSYLPLGCCTPLPPGMHAARTKIAVSGLCSLLERLFQAVARIGRFSGAVLFDVAFTPMSDLTDLVRVEVRGLHLRPSHIPVFVASRADGTTDLVRPVRGSTSTDDDTLVGLFRETDLASSRVRSLLSQQTGPILVPAALLPMGVVDGETGRLVTTPPVRSWPTLRRADTPPFPPDSPDNTADDFTLPTDLLAEDRTSLADLPSDETFHQTPPRPDGSPEDEWWTTCAESCCSDLSCAECADCTPASQATKPEGATRRKTTVDPAQTFALALTDPARARKQTKKQRRKERARSRRARAAAETSAQQVEALQLSAQEAQRKADKAAAAAAETQRLAVRQSELSTRADLERRTAEQRAATVDERLRDLDRLSHATAKARKAAKRTGKTK